MDLPILRTLVPVSGGGGGTNTWPRDEDARAGTTWLEEDVPHTGLLTYANFNQPGPITPIEGEIIEGELDWNPVIEGSMIWITNA